MMSGELKVVTKSEDVRNPRS
ncbi:protein of unknown function [Methylocella tundrae]|uniref:Uncharacterized protein n=1 Tax=Methylocella tundrae TaxID=227605 RepID=A0A4U8Z5L6_METTU|nr:protein of unknown function [Methylocella tundrae]